MISSDHVWMLAIALALDAIAGDPDLVWSRVRHPIVILGRVIGVLDLAFNRETARPWVRRAAGVFTLLVTVGIAAALGWVIEWLLSLVPFGWIGTVIIAAIMFAGRSLYDHVRAVERAFADSVEGARAAVSRIVGRDPGSLDESRICRAAIESAAENFSDGLVAPALWFALLGLPGLLAYKAINTADSMIGHLTPRHKDFGWAAARLDDLVNLPASRLAGLLIAFAARFGGGSIQRALGIMLIDAPLHRSPNAGWPEAAMAGALGISLGGPRRYSGIVVDSPFLNASGRRDAKATDIRKALHVYLGAWTLLLLAALLIAYAFWR